MDKARRDRLNLIRLLEGKGVLIEKEPTPEFWHWSVEIPHLLPIALIQNFYTYGEIRFFWN